MSIRNALITTAFAAALASSTGAMAQSTTSSDPAMSSVPADDGDDDSGKLGLLGLLGLAGLLGLKRKDDNHNRNTGVGNNNR